jgi:hypothetical protein
VGRERGRGLTLIDDLDDQIDAGERDLRHLGADHPYVPLVMTAPGSRGCWAPPSPPSWATSLGSRHQEALRRHRPVPRVYQSGRRDQRGPLANNGPPYLRWAKIEAAIHATHHPCDRDHDQPTKQRLGRQRGPKGRPPAGRPQAQRSHLVHAHPTPARCSGKAPTSALVA